MRKYLFTFIVPSIAVAGLALTAGISTHAQQPQPAKVDFATDIQPIFRQSCMNCHGPRQQKNGFRLDRRKDALRGGTITVIGPGNADGSRLYQKLIGSKYGPQMPPTGALPPEQIAKIRTWIDQGAEWPDALSGDVPATPPDPVASSLMDTLRAGNRAQLTTMLAANADAVNRRGSGGATPLMYGVLYGDLATVRTLIEGGADVNLADEGGATPLMWALTDLEKTKLLIEKGANVNARSSDGRSPILIASGISGNREVVKALLDAGANVKVKAPSLVGDTTPLVQAAYVGDEAIFKLLVERGADVAAAGVPALGLGMRSQCGGCIEVMMKALNPAAYTGTMMLGSPPLGPALATTMLLNAGADINARDPEGRTVLMLAAASGAFPVDVVKDLIARGADVNAKNPAGETALTYAKRHGNSPMTQLLEKAGAIDGSPEPEMKMTFMPAASPKLAVSRSIPLLQKADVAFTTKTGCISCHNNSLTALTVAMARSRSIPVDQGIAAMQTKLTSDYLESWRERVLQGVGIPGDMSTISYILMSLAAEKQPATPATDAMVRFLKTQQTAAGFWMPLAFRPPLEADPIATTAITLRALQLYVPAGEKDAYKPVIDRGAAWIAAATPRTPDAAAFKLLGMHWSGAPKAALQDAAKDLIAAQRPDGGWSQFPWMESDAYVTGLALVALAESGTSAVSDPVYNRGTQYLLKTQFADGSWHVRRRAVPLQPHTDAGFPFGKDQFISAAATNWAAMALTYATGKGS
jgi:ankyrin repeat protein/mono/diheme cytochrome c family protein